MVKNDLCIQTTTSTHGSYKPSSVYTNYWHTRSCQPAQYFVRRWNKPVVVPRAAGRNNVKSFASVSLGPTFSHCFLLFSAPSVVEQILFCCSSVVMQIEESSYEMRQPATAAASCVRIPVTNSVTGGREKSVSCTSGANEAAQQCARPRWPARDKLIPTACQLYRRFHRHRQTDHVTNHCD